MFTPSEIVILCNAVEALRREAREAATLHTFPALEDRINQYTRLLAKLKSPAMYSRG